jgi:hypothetical protein
VPNLPSVPIQPIIWEKESEYGMFADFKERPGARVLETYRYQSPETLLAELEEHVLRPAEQLLNRKE